MSADVAGAPKPLQPAVSPQAPEPPQAAEFPQAPKSLQGPKSPQTAQSAEALDALNRELPGRVVTDPAVLELLRVDRSGVVADGLPLALVEAESVADVQAVCRIASPFGVPVVTRGAGTGLAGGGAGGAGEIVLSTLRMNRILEVSAANQLAVVQPGILNGALNEELEGHGFWWAPDPASKHISTVGGNIATNAGGLLCAKYGVTREAVLGLKVVLIDGSLIDVGHRTVKGVTGLDLCALMVGSEGTLGVIVECTLKLRPLVPGVVPTIGAYFADVGSAARASAAVTASGIQPAIMELMDAGVLRAVSAYTGVDLASHGDSYLLIQTDGANAVAEAEGIVDVLRANGGTVEMTTDPQSALTLVDVRRQAYAAKEALGKVLVEDVSVPRDKLPAMFAKIDEVAARTGTTIVTVAHAGDGNLHPTFIYDRAEPVVPQAVWDAADELFTYAISIGGTLTGEHGVGLLKRQWLGEELGERQYELQRGIKRLFDPQGLLNPGKVFAK